MSARGALTPDTTLPPAPTQGWVPPGDGRRLWHYQLAGRTPCGRYGLFPESILVPETGGSFSDQGDCKACSRRLALQVAPR